LKKIRCSEDMAVFFPAQPQFSVLLALSLFFKPAPLYAGEPLELLKSAAERVIAVLKDPRLKAVEQKKERVEQLKAIINPIFDYDEVARRTLAGHWRRRTMVEQEEFTKLFRAFLEKIYSDRIGLYEGERVVFGRETVDQEYAEVESRLINSMLTPPLEAGTAKWGFQRGRSIPFGQGRG